MTDCPCHGCDDRISGETVEDCHAACERYLDWKAENDRVHALIREERNEAYHQNARWRRKNSGIQKWIIER